MNKENNPSKDLKKNDRKLYKQRCKENKKYINNKTINKTKPKNSSLPNGIVIQTETAWKIVAIEDKRFNLVKGVSLNVNDGDFLMIFGESGSGKTSLISLLSGLERPSEGNVNIMGNNTCALKNEELTKLREQYIGYIFQQYGLLKDISVLENVVITCKTEDRKRILQKNQQYKKWLKHYLEIVKPIIETIQDNTYVAKDLLWSKTTFEFYKWDYMPVLSSYSHLMTKEFYLKYLWSIIHSYETITRDRIFANEYIYDILKLLEIDGLINNKIMRLSGGQQQRVSIARAISKRPKILFADEPTGAVDTNTARSIMSLFVNLNKLYKTTIIMVSHNSKLTPLANRVITIESGNIIADEYNKNILSINEVDFE